MRVKVVQTCSVFLAGKSCSWHSGNLHSEQEWEAALTFVVTEGGAKIVRL